MGLMILLSKNVLEYPILTEEETMLFHKNYPTNLEIYPNTLKCISKSNITELMFGTTKFSK